MSTTLATHVLTILYSYSISLRYILSQLTHQGLSLGLGTYFLNSLFFFVR